MRQLCPDGGCVGVIGSDGTCKVCGRAAPNWGDERNRGLVTNEDDDIDEDEDDDDEDDDEDLEDEVAASPGNEGWDARKLCPDDSCIGVIGEDGACKVCGRRAA